MDDRLRALDRAARADPSDRAAGWALVAALDQAGDELGAWRERCRLAWAGDARAWTDVDRPVVEGVRELGPVVSRRFDGHVGLLTARRDVIVIEHGQELVGLDAATLETRWSRRWLGGAISAACGPRVAVTGEVDELLHVDARTGEEVGRTVLPPSPNDWWQVGRTADRLLLSSPDLGRVGGPLLHVDLTEGTCVREDDAADGASSDLLAGGVRVRQRPGALDAFDLRSQASIWSVQGAFAQDVDPAHVLASTRRRFVLIDLRAGEVTRSWELEPDDALLGHAAVVARTARHLIAFDRATGEERWRWPRPPGRRPAMSMSRELLVVAYELERGPGARVVGIDLLDERCGASRSRAAADLHGPSRSPTARSWPWSRRAPGPTSSAWPPRSNVTRPGGHAVKLAPSLLVLVLSPTLALADETPELHVVSRTDLPTAAERDGRLEAAEVRRVRLDLEAFSGALTVLEVHPALRTGGKVEAGATLVRLDPAPLERELRGAREALDDAKRSLAHEQAEHQVSLAAARDALEQAQASARDATRALERFQALDGGLLLDRARHSVAANEHYVADQREELEQLEAMYSGTKLAPETQEIVLERARRNLRHAERGLDQARRAAEVTTAWEHPDQLRALEERARWAAATLEQLQERQRLEGERRELRLAAASRSVRDAAERVSRLEADLARLTVAAPLGGVVEASSLLPGDRVSPGQQLTTVHDTSRLIVRFDAAEDDLRLLAPSGKVKLRLLAFGEVTLGGSVLAVAEVPDDGAAPTYPVVVQVDDVHPRARVGLRVRVLVQGELVRGALVVPRRAVEVEGGRATCQVWANGRATTVEVIVGTGNQESVQVLRGLVSGDEVVVPEAE